MGRCSTGIKKIEGRWKLMGVEPQPNFTEYDLLGTLNPPE
jgi:hypothetical protein